jgi:hypothetical protein
MKASLSGELITPFSRKTCNPLSGNDGTCGTDEATEVAAYTLGANDARLTGIGIEVDGLVTAIHT